MRDRLLTQEEWYKLRPSDREYIMGKNISSVLVHYMDLGPVTGTQYRAYRNWYMSTQTPLGKALS